MYGSWDMKCNRQNFLSLWTIFCLFTPLTTQKIKILKNWKKTWRYYHFTHLCHKWQSNDVWFLRYWAWQTDFFVILDHFLPFYPPNKPKYQNFEKILKTPGDIIILHMSTINYNYIMHGSWDIKHDRQSFFFILDNFLPSYPLKTWKIKILKVKKTPGDIIILHKCTKNQDHMLYCSWDMAHDGCNYFSFWTIFCPFIP